MGQETHWERVSTSQVTAMPSFTVKALIILALAPRLVKSVDNVESFVQFVTDMSLCWRWEATIIVIGDDDQGRFQLQLYF